MAQSELTGNVYEENMPQLQDVFSKEHGIRRTVCEVEFDEDLDPQESTAQLAALLISSGITDLAIHRSDVLDA